MNENGYWRRCHYCPSLVTHAVRAGGDLMREPREGDRLLWVCDEHQDRAL